MATTLKRCKGPKCSSAYQDEKYGVGVRVHNKCAKGNRCAVCGDISGSDEPAPKKEPEADTKAKKKK
jgi:hypothetical protein